MDNRPIFTNNALVRLLIPLFIEQILAVTVGMADTIMVASCGEAAVSAVSLVDSINFLLIQLFTALATGGAVITAQYIGRQDKENTNSAAKQLIYISAIISVVLTAVSVIFNNQIINTIYGKIETDVMVNSVNYYYFTALSYPFLALYNASASLFRAVGNSRVSMMTSFLMNAVNISGNALLIYGIGLGVSGAAIATLVSRIIGAVIMILLITRRSSEIYIHKLFKIKLKPDMVKRILNIGVPSGLENSMFQVGKLLVASLITTFGTAAIAANAVANTISLIAVLPGSAINLALITTVGQCVGAKEYEQAKGYTIKLMAVMYAVMGTLCAGIFLFAPAIADVFNLSDTAYSKAIEILRIYTSFCAIIWPVAFGLPNALRAAGDTKFTMTVSVISMWIFRIGCSYLLAVTFNLGLDGIWYAMYIDWLVRSTIFIIRFNGGGWKKIRVIE